MGLRDYQNKFLHELRIKMRSHKHVIGCMATGSGKTKTFLHIAKTRVANGGTVLILSESTKIYKQIANESQCIHINPDNKHAYAKTGYIHLAMAQTLMRRLHLITMFKSMGDQLLIIVDECHIGTMTKLLITLKEAYIIGFTATPDYRFAKHLPKIYGEIVVGPQPDELVETGHLSHYIHWERANPDTSQFEVADGDFNNSSQEAYFERTAVYDGLFDDLQLFEFKKCIIFTASIHHCDALYEQMKTEGYDCVKQHSGQSNAEQSYHLAQFCGGPINIMVTVGILTKGFDYPPIDLVILMRATLSLPLYLQMIGRGSRMVFDSTGNILKGRFTVLDYGGNWSRHKPWDMDRDWAHMWKEKKRREGVTPMKDCPKCGYIMMATKMECPNCGYQFERKQELAQKETVLIERTAIQHAGRKLTELDHLELAKYATNRQKKAQALAVAQHRERYQPGFLQAYAVAMNYSPGWLYDQLADIASGVHKHFEDTIIQ